MIKVRMLALACGVASAALALAPWASAQDKTPPIQKKEAAKQSFDDLLKSHQQGNGSYRFVSGDETLTSGDAVSITRKGADKRVTGTFVYSDTKTGKLYIRPRAGERPVGIPAGDVDKIERVTPAVGTPEKGGIRPAIEQGEKPAQRYEIHTMTVQNGPYRTTFFYDMSLSGAERDQLSAMEKAGNDIVQKGTTIESLRTAMQNAPPTPAPASCRPRRPPTASTSRRTRTTTRWSTTTFTTTCIIRWSRSRPTVQHSQATVTATAVAAATRPW